MLEIIKVVLLVFSLSSAPVDVGWGSHYANTVMQSPVEYHGYEYGDGRYIAVSDCSLIGDYVLIRQPGNDWELHQVADCAGADGTPQWMAENNIILELSYETARRWGVVGGGFAVECLGCR